MSIFSFFKGNKQSKKPKGMIAYFQLEDWWNEEFSDEERQLIEEVYQPMGGSSLTSGDIRSTSISSIAFLHTLAGWFQKSEHRYIAQKCLKKAESLVDTNTRALDLHFLLSNKITTLYKDRDNSPDGLERAIEACKQQIDFAEEAKAAFEKEYNGHSLPSHVGYRQLAIVLEKQKKFTEAIDLVEIAKSQGWSGDWDKRIERCTKKMGLGNP